MSADRSDAYVMTYRTQRGRGVRHRVEPAAEGYIRVEEVLTLAGEWREVGTERLESFEVETPD